MRAGAPPGPNDLDFCDDAGQRIYRAAFPWSRAGIDVRGRASQLKLTYRTTEQIHRFADRILPSSIDEGDGEPWGRQAVSLLHRAVPDVCRCVTRDEEIAALVGWLRQRIHDEKLRPQDTRSSRAPRRSSAKAPTRR